MTKVRWGKSIQSKDEQYELKRAAILRTAGRLFNQKGFRETSLNDLADELRVTKPTLYYYVENKEDILFQCLYTAITELLERTDAILGSGRNGIEKLAEFIHLFISVFDDEFGRCLARPGPEPLSSKYLAAIEPLYIRLDTALRQMIEDGMADGSMRRCNTKITTFTLLGAIRWMTRWYHPEGEMTTRQVADEMAGLFCHGLANPASPVPQLSA